MKVANLLDEEIPQIYALTGRWVEHDNSSHCSRVCVCPQLEASYVCILGEGVLASKDGQHNVLTV